MRTIATIAILAVTLLGTAQTTTNKIHKKVQVGGKNAASAQGTGATQSPLADWVKGVTMQHSPRSWELLMKYQQLPSTIKGKTTGGGIASTTKPVGTFHFLEGKSKPELLQSMGTNVHEIAHAYFRHNALAYAAKNNRVVDYNNAEGYIYVSPTQCYYVSFPVQRLFRSKELAAVIPANLRTLRYATYIGGNTSSQLQGVIGLLNEFHAYYLGAQYAYDMMEAYCGAEATPAQGFLTWVQHAQSVMDAYYEFGFFIREYLLYMSQNHPKSYAALKAYRPFWQAFGAIDKAYGGLNGEYRQRIRNQVPLINKKGKGKLSVEGAMLWLDAGGSKRVGTSLTLQAKQKLSPRLNGDRYNKVMANL